MIKKISKKLFNFNKILKDLENKGFSRIKNYKSEEKCLKTIKVLETILSLRIKKSEFVGNSNNQVLYNYFIEFPDLLDFVYDENIFKLMSKVLDEDHVLTSTSARNKRILKTLEKSSGTSGIGWHTDTRYVFQNKVPVKPSLSYIVIFLLEDFTKENAATQFVPYSHKFNFRPERNKAYETDFFIGKKGDIFILDTSLFHKAGVSSIKSRWAIFSMYSSWFIKPYFQFDKMFKKKELESLNPELKQLFHCNSIPPKNHRKNRATLKRVQNK
ncbi:MAG: hypothetical protein CBC22_03655 [Alphaproteobacteria bacterium TMED62]|nr:MAG: hypothetical protein CBC22_03655 [Alphaproteobacteria bacterium TMED62]|tara:strand:- start:3936 stop:4748 length:813 start_codon:yes stop_codon:yes gene_type:complete